MNGSIYDELENLKTTCCRKLCKTEQMDDKEFDEYTAEHCEECPIYDLTGFYQKTLEEQKNAALKKIDQVVREVIEKEIVFPE